MIDQIKIAHAVLRFIDTFSCDGLVGLAHIQDKTLFSKAEIETSLDVLMMLGMIEGPDPARIGFCTTELGKNESARLDKLWKDK